MYFSKINKMPIKANVIPVSISAQLGKRNPVTSFERLRKNSHCSFLMEKTSPEKPNARYSFLGLNPYKTIRICNGSLIIRHDGEDVCLTGNPLEQLTEYLSKFQMDYCERLPPFYCGVVGYIGYDCVKYFEEIPINENDLDSDEAYLAIFRDAVVFDHREDRVTVVCNVFLDDEEYKSGVLKAHERSRNILKTLNETCRHVEKGLVVRACKHREFDALLGRDAFMDKARAVKEEIRKGEIFQCVLSERFSLPVKSEPLSIFKNLREISPSPYLYILSMDQVHIVGASPETLVRVQGRKVETCPIAGTRPRSQDEAQDRRYERSLLRSVKEKAEHLMLVDLGRNDIGRIATPGSVAVKDFMHVERFSSVMHLVSTVKGLLRSDLSALDAFFSAFPAGTLTGAPKIRAMKIISELETRARGPYGGAIVMSDFSGRFDSCINIRSAFIKDGVAHVQTGAGIVADSNPSKEYEEVLNKSLSIRKAIAMTEGSSI